MPRTQLSEARRAAKNNHYCKSVVFGFSIYEVDGKIDWLPKGNTPSYLHHDWKLLEVWTFDIQQREWKQL